MKRATDLQLSALVRKLHAWELAHLRELVEQQRQQIDELAASNQRLYSELTDAEDRARFWHEDALRAIEEAGAVPGLTMDGHIVALQPAPRGLQ
ncbi:MAG: hypothetical protein IV107_23980 [Paucibacter sp.]|nr:hypothetical protein [Roseateles sp.]